MEADNAVPAVNDGAGVESVASASAGRHHPPFAHHHVVHPSASAGVGGAETSKATACLKGRPG